MKPEKVYLLIVTGMFFLVTILMAVQANSAVFIAQQEEVVQTLEMVRGGSIFLAISAFLTFTITLKF